MSNSGLASTKYLFTTNYDKRKQKITRITIHHAATVGTCTTLAGVLKAGAQCSWNYGIGNDGEIGLFVDEKYRAWGTANPDNDHRSINIEVCNSTGAPEWKISDKAYKSLIELCADICSRNGIKKITYTGKLEGSNLMQHCWFVSTACPGPYLKSKFDDIAKQVNAKLKDPNYKPKSPTQTASSYNAAITGDYIDPTSIIKAKNIDPFIATISPSAENVNYSKLKKMGVVGVMLNAGYLYDSSHVQRSSYHNKKLKTEVPKIEKQNLPYALYATVRARTVKEAVAECRELYYTVSQYPPSLGLWLKLDLVTSKSTNHAILDVYYRNILSWGLKDKCGLYVTRKQLDKIDWKKYHDKFYLWLNDHLSSLDSLDELLTPQLFKL